MAEVIVCDECKGEIHQKENSIFTGYALRHHMDQRGSSGGLDTYDKVCYKCCAKIDTQHMQTHDSMTLYLEGPSRPPARFQSIPRKGGENIIASEWKVANWPGTLKFQPTAVRISRHNIAGVRFDVWFKDENGNSWHGVNYGWNSQLLHCKKRKRNNGNSGFFGK